MERVEIIRDLRLGEFDVLVGINLLREGLDLPEVSLVAILDADKEGFLRSERSLIQTIGRRAPTSTAWRSCTRMVTESIQKALAETERRRRKQRAYNEHHRITPKGVMKRIKDLIDGVYDALRPGPRRTRRATRSCRRSRSRARSSCSRRCCSTPRTSSSSRLPQRGIASRN